MIEQEVFLQHGITIGRATSNMVCIEDLEVEHIHARVLRQGDGSFILQSEDRATFEVLDADGGDSQKTGQVGVK